MRTQELFNFMYERHQIYLRRLAGEAKPWTLDPILQRYRFTCAYRELDKVTVWIRENWRDPHRDDPDVWFAMCVARYINWPDTLEAIGYPIPWNRERVVKKLEAIRNGEGHCFGGAYFLNSIGPKIQSVVNDRLHRLWLARKQITKELQAETTLEGAYNVLLAQYGFGSFMSAQIVADIRYTSLFDKATDGNNFVAPGPGSRRGLAYAMNVPKLSTRNWFVYFGLLHAAITPMVRKAKMPPLHAQNLQGWLCEFSKYEKARLGEGRPKAKYPGI